MEQNDLEPKDPWARARQMFPRVVDYIARTDPARGFWELVAGSFRAFIFLILVMILNAALWYVDDRLPGRSIYDNPISASFAEAINILGWIVAFFYFLFSSLRTFVVYARRRKRKRGKLWKG